MVDEGRQTINTTYQEFVELFPGSEERGTRAVKLCTMYYAIDRPRWRSILIGRWPASFDLSMFSRSRQLPFLGTLVSLACRYNFTILYAEAHAVSLRWRQAYRVYVYISDIYSTLSRLPLTSKSFSIRCLHVKRLSGSLI